MSENCKCPICRFADGELKASEIGWYLKGSIEHQKHYLDLIKNATSLEELKDAVRFDRCDLDANYSLLDDLHYNEKRNPDAWWDPAMDCPDKYRLNEG